MLALAADENFRAHILRGLRRPQPALDIVRVQDVGLAATPDPDILQWAADAGRVVVSHDITTMKDFAWARVVDGQPMPGG